MRLLCVVLITSHTYKVHKYVRKQINHYNSVNKWNLTGLLYVAWVDRLFVDCFGLFHMVLTHPLKLHWLNFSWFTFVDIWSKETISYRLW